MWQDMEHAGRRAAAGAFGQSPEDSHQPRRGAIGRARRRLCTTPHLWLAGRPREGA